MVLNLGGFKFTWKQVGGISLETEFGVSSQDRIQNHPVLFAANLGNQTISVDGQTLPYQGDKQTALKRLYDIAYSRQSYALTNGNGKYFGRFAVVKIREKQAVFTPNGAFFTQSFNIELKRDFSS